MSLAIFCSDCPPQNRSRRKNPSAHIAPNADRFFPCWTGITPGWSSQNSGVLSDAVLDSCVADIVRILLLEETTEVAAARAAHFAAAQPQVVTHLPALFSCIPVSPPPLARHARRDDTLLNDQRCVLLQKQHLRRHAKESLARHHTPSQRIKTGYGFNDSPQKVVSSWPRQTLQRKARMR